MKLSRFEICKRVAEIDNQHFKIKHIKHYAEKTKENPDGIFSTVYRPDVKGGFWNQVYNPLHSMNICIELMRKHKVMIAYSHNGDFCASIRGKCFKSISENINMAVCLAIIKHNELET